MPKVDYEERQEEKLERYQELADKNKTKSENNFKRSHDLADQIPFGQPIMVGHHSEGMHRRQIKKIDNAMRKGIEDSEKADYYSNKVKNLENVYTISQDDPEAIRKLKLKLQGIEKDIEKVKEHNKKCKGVFKLVAYDYRKGYTNIVNDNAGKYQIAKIIDGVLTYESKNTSEEIKKYVQNYVKTGKFNQPEIPKDKKVFDSYVLQNLNGNKTTVKKRIEHLQALDKVKAQEWKNNNITLEINKDENRIMLYFPSKPDEETRTKLKRHGFRWSPRNTAWQSYINQWNLDFAKKEILEIEK